MQRSSLSGAERSRRVRSGRLIRAASFDCGLSPSAQDAGLFSEQMSMLRSAPRRMKTDGRRSLELKAPFRAAARRTGASPGVHPGRAPQQAAVLRTGASPGVHPGRTPHPGAGCPGVHPGRTSHPGAGYPGVHPGRTPHLGAGCPGVHPGRTSHPGAGYPGVHPGRTSHPGAGYPGVRIFARVILAHPWSSCYTLAMKFPTGTCAAVFQRCPGLTNEGV